MIRCVAIDDEPLALGKMSDYISKTPFLELAGTFRSALESISMISDDYIDLLFIDINMPDLNGLDFVRSLKDRPKVIFTTAFSEYAFEGFKVNALDYLLKPIGYNDFLKSANKARKYFDSIIPADKTETRNREFLFIKADYRINKISFRDIIYIEGMREYVRIHLTGGRSLMPLYSLRVLEEQLPSEMFMRVHRSYIVNLEKISSVEHNRIVFDGKVFIPVSEQYREGFQKFLISNSLG